MSRNKEKRVKEMAKPWFKCISPDHPIAIEVVDEFGPEGFYYLAQLLDLFGQVGSFELTPQILKQHCKLNAQKVGRIYQKIAKKLEESIKILEKTSKKVPTLDPSNPVPDCPLIEESREERIEENIPPNPQAYGEHFLKFWKVYPRGDKKADSWKSWKKQKLDSQTEIIISAVERFKKSKDWQKEGGKFIPHASSFLNQRRWEDDSASEANKTPEVSPLDELLKFPFVRNVMNGELIPTSQLQPNLGRPTEFLFPGGSIGYQLLEGVNA